VCIPTDRKYDDCRLVRLSVCLSGWLAPFVISLSVTHLSLRIVRVWMCAGGVKPVTFSSDTIY
jgi:hypothetical protein